MFSAEQRANQVLYLHLFSSREAVVNTITSNVLRNSLITGSRSTTLWMQEDLDQMVDHVGSAIIPFLSSVGKYYSYFTGTLITIGLLKLILGAIIRIVILYQRRGLGWWMILALWHMAFLMVEMPWRMLTNLGHDQILFPGGDDEDDTADGRP